MTISTVYIIFFLSGISGLIYETVWLRMLTRILGSTVYASSIILASFMAGLALGSFYFGRRADRSRDAIRLYAWLELGAGTSAMLVTMLLSALAPLYQAIYAGIGGNRATLTAIQALLMFLLLLVPTFLMGGTLPVLGSYTKRFGQDLSVRIGSLYGLNTLGAVLGTVASGLLLLGWLGERRTVLIGVFLNFLVSLAALMISRKFQRREEAGTTAAVADAAVSPYGPGIRRLVLSAYAINGFASLAMEVVWTRMFQVHLGTSIYAFSMMLGIYLLGIALGSWLGAAAFKKLKDPLGFIGLGQAWVAVYSAAGLFIFLLFRPAALDLGISFSNILLVPLAMVFPITLVLGMLFPLVSRSYVRSDGTAGRDVGALYSANTIGCIAGSLVCGFLMMKFLGTRWTIIAMAGANGLMGLGLAWVGGGSKRFVAAAGAALALVIGLTSPDPFLTVARQKVLVSFGPKAEILYHREGVDATTTAVDAKRNVLDKYLWVNGIGMTKLCLETKLMAHLPLLLHPDPKDILVICFGMGTTLRSARSHPGMRCEVVELVAEVYDCFKFFHRDAGQVMADPRTSHYVDDGRNFLLLRDKQYDVITIDPAPPLWSAGTVNLYSREFFQLCLKRLKPNGILCLWVPPDAFTEVRYIMATYQRTVPVSSVWGGPSYPGLYLIGSKNTIIVDGKRFEQAEKIKSIVDDLTEWDTLIQKPEDMLNLLVLNPDEFSEFVRGEDIITDDHPLTEFPLWRQKFHKYRNFELNAIALYKWKTKYKSITK